MCLDQSSLNGKLLLEKYKYLKPLGKGGMGTVFLVKDEATGRKYAVKATSADARGRREQEYLMKAKEISGIPFLYDWKEENGVLFLVMDYIRGKSLKDHTRKISQTKMIRLALSLCEILKNLHSQEPGIVCLDLKPGHILISPFGKIYLIDFGISAYIGEKIEPYGTKGFAAPEQLFGTRPADPQMDLFSFGKIMAFCRKGRKWSRLDKMMKDCTKTDLKERYQSIESLEKDLKKEAGRMIKKQAMLLSLGLFLLIFCFGAIEERKDSMKDRIGDQKQKIQDCLFGDLNSAPDYILARQYLKDFQGKDSEIARYQRLLNCLENKEKILSWKQIWKDLEHCRKRKSDLYETYFLVKVYLSCEKQLTPYGNSAKRAWEMLERAEIEESMKQSKEPWDAKIEEQKLWAAFRLADDGEMQYLDQWGKKQIEKAKTQEDKWKIYQRIAAYLEGKGEDPGRMYETFLRDYPSYGDAYIEYGIYLCRHNQWKKAREIYERGEKNAKLTGEKAKALKGKLGI